MDIIYNYTYVLLLRLNVRYPTVITVTQMNTAAPAISIMTTNAAQHRMSISIVFVRDRGGKKSCRLKRNRQQDAVGDCRFLLRGRHLANWTKHTRYLWFHPIPSIIGKHDVIHKTESFHVAARGGSSHSHT